MSEKHLQMNGDQVHTLLQRFGGHLVLVIIATLLFVWGPALSGGNMPDSDEGSRPSPATLPALVVQEIAIATSTLPAETAVDFSRFPVLTDHSLAPVLNPHTFQGKRPAHDFQTYVVQAGDTPNRIAERFNIKPETLLGGNPWLSHESGLLGAGVELVILPVDGLLYEVREGDTLETIAERLKVPVEDMIAYGPNNLEFPYRLYPGTQLLVPGAVQELFVWTPPTSGAASGGRGPGFASAVPGTGTFTWPTNGRCLTTYYWYGHRAVDVSLAIGSPLIAADTGTVTYASWAAGTYFDYGNLIVIDHGNGYETFYAHLNDIAVYPGQVVYKGNYIGASGNTGRSSGPHLHFEIRYIGNQLDPLSHLGGATRDCR